MKGNIMLKIHTFEMKKGFLTDNEFAYIRNNLKAGYQYSHFENSQRYNYYAEKGIEIILIRCKYVPNTMTIKINPQKVLGVEKQQNLFELSETEFMKCLESVYEILEKNKIVLTEFKISRLDFTQDICFDKSEIIDIYIKLLNKTGAPYRYKKMYSKEKYKTSYNIITNSNNWEIAVYNKEQESKDRNKRNGIMYGIMRTEVRIFDFVEMNQVFSNGILHFDRVIKMQELANIILLNVFVDGFYIKLDKTKNILSKKYYSRNITKRQQNSIQKMIELSETIAIHRSLYDCIRGTDTIYSYDTIKNIKKRFVEERINLVSICANEHFSVLPDMKYILGIKSEIEKERDNQFLARNKLLNKLPTYKIL